MSWSLHDPVTTATYVLPIGPSAVDNLDRQRSPLYAEVPAAGAVVLLAPPTPPTLSFTGTLIDQSEYVQLTAWAAKDYPVQIIDDRTVTTNVLITDWTPVRVWKAYFPWYHTWTLRVLVLDATA